MIDKKMIKELVEKVVAFEIVGPNDYEEVLNGIEYLDYYVRPGESQKNFVAEYGAILETRQYGVGAGVQEDFADFICFNCILALVKKSFDRAYFSEWMNAVDVVGDKTLLNDYIYKLNKRRLKNFLVALNQGKHEKGLFFSTHSASQMWEELNQACVKVDKNVVDINAPEYREFVRKDPLYAFNYLRTERIARIIYEHIDKNAEAAGVLARKIYDSKSKVYA